jgi:hypothetical protein
MRSRGGILGCLVQAVVTRAERLNRSLTGQAEQSFVLPILMPNAGQLFRQLRPSGQFFLRQITFAANRLFVENPSMEDHVIFHNHNLSCKDPTR